MELSLQQINNLITGTAMAAELPASKEGSRRFLEIYPLERGEHGRFVRASKSIKRSKYETVFFRVHIYELPSEYFENGWDASEEELTFHQKLGFIQGIAALEDALKAYLQDFSMLLTWDKTDSLGL